MLNVTKELTALARKLGYEGKAPDTVAKAINAITSVAGEGGGSGDGCDCEPGYEMVETQLFSETVTTTQLPFGTGAVGMLEYSGTEYPDTLQITFNGTEYECSRTAGAYDPTGESNIFRLNTIDGMWSLFTPNAGTYSISAIGELVQISDEFNSAVHKSIGNITAPMLCIAGETTFDEMEAAQSNAQMMYFQDDMYYFVTNMWDDGTSQGVTFIPESEYLTATFDQDGIFTLEYN